MGWFSDACSWVGDRATAAYNNTVSAINTVGQAASTVVEAVRNPEETFRNVVNAAGETLGDIRDGLGNGLQAIGNGLQAVGDGLSYAWNNPGEIMNTVGNGLSTAWNETCNFGRMLARDPGRAFSLVGQGIVNSVTVTAGSIIDLAGEGITMLAYDYNPTRFLINGAANFVGLEGPLRDRTWSFNVTDTVLEHTQWIEPRDNYERTLLYGTQAIAEIGSFVALTAVTGGVYAGVRGAAGVARGARLATGASRMLAGAASWGRAVAPITRTAIGLETAFATVSFAHGMSSSQRDAQTAEALRGAGLSEEEVSNMTASERRERLEQIHEERQAEANNNITTELTETLGVPESQLEGLDLAQKQELYDQLVAHQDQLYTERLLRAGMTAEELEGMSLEDKVERSVEIMLMAAGGQETPAGTTTDTPIPAAVASHQPEPAFQTTVNPQQAFSSAAPRVHIPAVASAFENAAPYYVQATPHSDLTRQPPEFNLSA